MNRLRHTILAATGRTTGAATIAPLPTTAPYKNLPKPIVLSLHNQFIASGLPLHAFSNQKLYYHNLPRSLRIEQLF
jgi:hypothetical protein